MLLHLGACMFSSGLLPWIIFIRLSPYSAVIVPRTIKWASISFGPPWNFHNVPSLPRRRWQFWLICLDYLFLDLDAALVTCMVDSASVFTAMLITSSFWGCFLLPGEIWDLHGKWLLEIFLLNNAKKLISRPILVEVYGSLRCDKGKDYGLLALKVVKMWQPSMLICFCMSSCAHFDYRRTNLA